MEEIICSQNINSTIFCYSMDFSGISKQNAHGERNVLPKMFVGRWWYFLEKCWKTGWSEQDVRDRLQLPWMATGAVPVRIRTATHFSLENSHRETSHWGRTFRSPWAFVGFAAALRYEPCTQFINVSQRALHIYWQFSAMSHAIHKIVSKRRCQSYFISRHSPHHGKSKNRDLWASSQSRFLLWALACWVHRSFSKRRNGDVRNNKPPAMRVVGRCL